MNGNPYPVEKIVMVAYACDPTRGSEPGAGGRMFLAAARIAAAQGIECHVITRPKHVDTLRRYVQSAVPEAHGRVHSVTPPRFISGLINDGSRLHSLLWQFQAYRYLLSTGLTEGCQVVHHVTFASDTLPSVVHMPKLGRIRKVWGPVGSSDSRLENPLGVHQQLFAFLKKQWFRLLASRVSVVVCQTQHVADRLKGSATPAIVEQNCIVEGLPLSGNGSIEASQLPIKVAFLGVLNRRKRASLAIDALRATGHNAWQLIVIGDGPLRPDLERDNADLVAAGALRFTGWVPQNEALALLSSCRGVIHPSVREGAPWAIAEALTMGKWVVTVEGNGADALVRSTNGGAVVPELRVGMAEALGEAVLGQIASGVTPVVEGRWAGARFEALLREWYFSDLYD